MYGEEKEKEQSNLHAPGGRSYGMARQCSRGHSSCKAREGAGVTPTNTTTATHGDDGTDCSSTRARSVSGSVTARARARRRSPNRPRRFSTRSSEEAIRQERKQSEKPRGQIDRSSRGGPDQVGGEVREAWRRPEHGGGHGGDAIARASRERLGGMLGHRTVHTNHPPSADDACDTEGSVRDDDADHDAFVNAAVEETRAPPVKRSIGGFADEDDLHDIDEGFIEPPSKKSRSDVVPPVVAASEASAPKATPTAQASTASSLSKGKDIPVATTIPPSDLRGVISSLEAFASQFTSLEADNVRLQEEVKSSSSKLDDAIKKAAKARQEVDSLKEELSKLKERLKEEEARAAEKDELLRQSALALLEAASIPAAALDKVPNNSPANGASMALASHQLTRELLEKGKGALARMHSIIFPTIKQEKTLGQLIDAFAVDTKEVIEVFPVPSFVDDSSGVLPEGDRIQRMKDRITQMEKDLRSTYAELLLSIRRARLQPTWSVIALNRAEENKRIHERVHALTQLSSAEEIFWREHSKASTVAQFQDRVQQVHHFFDKCYKAMRVVWKTMFPLNAVPPCSWL
ncbi:hypothetical protein QYE76_061743 [Lolium multiflorum]|uniref:Uncharacterized protein n=1 Tax=Lolium multiflorum TaxID=4521 RepID=A0AAD8W5H1_LOLMU|nr:hypothetical protein QYE76_061743 [Lolium multiflorum]